MHQTMSSEKAMQGKHLYIPGATRDGGVTADLEWSVTSRLVLPLPAVGRLNFCNPLCCMQ